MLWHDFIDIAETNPMPGALHDFVNIDGTLPEPGALHDLIAIKMVRDFDLVFFGRVDRTMIVDTATLRGSFL